MEKCPHDSAYRCIYNHQGDSFEESSGQPCSGTPDISQELCPYQKEEYPCFVAVFDGHGYNVTAFEAINEAALISGVKRFSGLAEESSMDYAFRFHTHSTMSSAEADEKIASIW